MIDANGQSLAYVYSRDNDSDALISNVLTTDEARRIASNIAKLPTPLRLGQLGKPLPGAGELPTKDKSAGA